MSIQIIDSFKVNVQKPIDDRTVVGPQFIYTNRNQIDYKYNGLRIWDLNDNIPYVWNNGTWSSEVTSGIAGSGTINYLSKFTTINSISISQVYDNGTNVGIGNTSPAYKLDVTGTIRSSSGFYGNGANITNINASNISTGTLAITRLPNGITGQILVAGGSAPFWANTSTLTGLTASFVSTANESLDSSDNYLTFVNSVSSGTQLKVSTTKLRFVPSTGQLAVSSANTPSTPVITFIGDTDTGLYRPASNILAISTNGFERARFGSNGGLAVGTTSVPNNGIRTNDVYFSRLLLNIDSSTGVYTSGPGNITFATNLTNIVSMNNVGNLGIGIANPTSKLHVIGGANITGGLTVRLTIAFSVANASGVTYNHNLGYIPIAMVVCNDGNVNPNITLINTTQIRIYNFNSGGNTTNGTIYLW